MRSLVGVQIVQGGTIEVLGLPAGHERLRHQVAYLTQDPSVYGDLTVRENLAYFATILGVARDDVDRVIDEVDLGSCADQRTDRLSGGQRARVSLATALLGDPAGARPRRAHGRARPGAAARPVGAVRAAGPRRRDPAGLQPRDGRGDPLRARSCSCATGGCIADGTLDELLAQTGTTDAESAFLRLGRGARGGAPVTARRTLATSRRVAEQLRHDRRTVALLMVMPLILLGLLALMLDEAAFDQSGPILLGLFPLLVMFLVTSVATLRERTSGTLERLLTMPLAKADFVLGYALTFGLVAVVQSLLLCTVSFSLYGLDVRAPTWAFVLVAVADGLLGTSLGLFVSAFARTEFQAVQMLPVVLLPQFLLCGFIVPREELPDFLRWVSDLLPLSYAVDATKALTITGETGGRLLAAAGDRRGVRGRPAHPGLGHAAPPHAVAAERGRVTHPTAGEGRRARRRI